MENPAHPIRIYPQTSIEPKNGAFSLKNQVSAHGLVLLPETYLPTYPTFVTIVTVVTVLTAVTVVTVVTEVTKKSYINIFCD